jgi:hypothetical protein
MTFTATSADGAYTFDIKSHINDGLTRREEGFQIAFIIFRLQSFWLEPLEIYRSTLYQGFNYTYVPITPVIWPLDVDVSYSFSVSGNRTHWYDT